MTRPAPRILLGTFLSAALAAVTAAPAAAQIVNVQAKIDDVPEGLSGAAEGSVDWRTGNSELLLLGGGGRLVYRDGPDLVFAIARADYGKIFHTDPNVEIAAKTFEHLRYRRQLSGRFIAEAFVQHEADRFRRLTVRALAGGGPRLVASSGERHGVFIGVAYMFEYERLADDEQPDAGERQHNHRLSSYVVSNYEAGSQVKLTQALYVQPRLDDPADLRMLVDLGVSSKLADHLALKTAFVLAWDRRPADDIAGLETVLKTSLEVSF